MRKFLTLLASCVLLTFTYADANGQQKAASDKAALESAFAKAATTFLTAMNEGRYGDVTPLYTDDAIVLAANAPSVKGASAIREFWTGMGAFKPRDIKLTSVEYEVHGDVAIELGVYTMKLTPPGADAEVSDTGKYLVVWQRQADGSWKIYRDMFSSDLPAQ